MREIGENARRHAGAANGAADDEAVEEVVHLDEMLVLEVGDLLSPEGDRALTLRKDGCVALPVHAHGPQLLRPRSDDAPLQECGRDEARFVLGDGDVGTGKATRRANAYAQHEDAAL